MNLIFGAIAFVSLCVLVQSLRIKFHNQSGIKIFVEIQNPDIFLYQQLLNGRKINYNCVIDEDGGDLFKMQMWKSTFNSVGNRELINVMANIKAATKLNETAVGSDASHDDIYFGSFKLPNSNEIKPNSRKNRGDLTLNCQVVGRRTKRGWFYSNSPEPSKSPKDSSTPSSTTKRSVYEVSSSAITSTTSTEDPFDTFPFEDLFNTDEEYVFEDLSDMEDFFPTSEASVSNVPVDSPVDEKATITTPNTDPSSSEAVVFDSNNADDSVVVKNSIFERTNAQDKSKTKPVDATEESDESTNEIDSETSKESTNEIDSETSKESTNEIDSETLDESISENNSETSKESTNEIDSETSKESINEIDSKTSEESTNEIVDLTDFPTTFENLVSSEVAFQPDTHISLPIENEYNRFAKGIDNKLSRTKSLDTDYPIDECITLGHVECSKYNALCVQPVNTPFLCVCPNGFYFPPTCLNGYEAIAFRCPCPEGQVFNNDHICIEKNCEFEGEDGCVERKARCRYNLEDPTRSDCSCPRGMFAGPNCECLDVDDVKLSIVEKNQTVRQGQNAVIRCRDEGRWRLPVRWTRPSKYIMSSFAEELCDRLRIVNSQPSDDGIYICYVGDKYSTLVPSETAQLVVNPTGECSLIRVRIHPKPEYIDLGCDVRVSCRDEGPNHLPVEWFKEHNQALPADSSVTEGVLLLPEVQLKDVGWYTCRTVENFRRNRHCIFDTFYLGIKGL